MLGRRDGSAYGDGLWGLPGGRVELSEALAEAAAREVWEEVGVKVGPLQLVGVRRYEVEGVWGVDFFFRAGEWQGEAHPLHKTSEVGWFTLQNLPPDLLPWIPPLLDSYLARGVVVAEQLESPDRVSFLHGAKA